MLWGCFPIFWKALHGISAFEAITHRIVWSCLFLLPVVWWQGSGRALVQAFRDPRVVGLSAFKGLLLSSNWLMYIWAVNRGQVVESSLGYFLVPLVNALFGRLFLGERVSRLQGVSIVLAGIGVVLMLIRVGHVPWIAFGLASTWSIYGLLKKRSPLGPIVGLTVETLVFFLPCAGLLVWWAMNGGGGLGHADAWTHLLILLTGVVTAVPLVLFAKGAQSIRLMTLGLLQYITPTVQFLIGIFVYHEAFDSARLQSFAFIWIGLAVYSLDAVLAERARRMAGIDTPT
ncbi:EamA family transporter RarD [Nibricoccus sp. IMCC34717]|uniref:EamA family transporter RarD n=1 Tax=Nibricoccus sp. IMCC34717 TaxID=3034021 RepID=UPI00384D45F9